MLPAWAAGHDPLHSGPGSGIAGPPCKVQCNGPFIKVFQKSLCGGESI